MAITLAIFAAISFFLFGLKPVGKGLILGTIFSILNFVLMGEAVPMKVGRSRNKAVAFSLMSIGVRFGLMAIPLIAAIKLERFHFAATVCGLFMVQFVILADGVIRLIYNSTLKKTV